MGLAVKVKWVDAHMRSPHKSNFFHSDRSHNARTGQREPPFSLLADEILGVFANEHRRAGGRLTISSLPLHHETEPAIAAALSELACNGLVRVADAGTIELTTKGYDLIQGRVRQGRGRLLGGLPNE